MPRSLRIIQPGQPLHIRQRGVDRTPTFLAEMDFAFYRLALRDAADDVGCAVHAYVLMTNHVHLLVTPRDANGPARMMQSLGRSYVRYFNDRYHRTGTLWEGRYRSTRVTSLHYLFACSRYIELNPVRAGLVADPFAYEWSSFRRNARGQDDPVITPHSAYLRLGEGHDGACEAYHALFAIELAPSEIAAVRVAALRRSTLPVSAYRLAVQAIYPDASRAAADETLMT